MTRDIFLNTLRYKLGNMRPDVLEEIISDFEEHFLVASENGFSEDEICKILGDPADIAKQYAEELSRDADGDAEDIENEFAYRKQEPPRPPKSPRSPRPPRPPRTPGYRGFINIDGKTIDLSGLDHLGEYIDDSLQKGLRQLQRKINGIDFDRIGDKIRGAFGNNFGGFDEFSDFGDGAEARCDISREFDASEISSIQLNCKKADVRIYGTNDKKISFHFGDDEKVAYRISFDGGRLFVSDAIGYTRDSGFRRSTLEECHIGIPEGWNGSLYVKTISGDIRIRDVKGSNEISLNAISGDIGIENCSALIFPSCTSGDISIKNFTVPQANSGEDFSYIIKTASGDAHIEGFVCRVKTAVITGSGDIRVNDSEADIKIRTGSGDVEVQDVKGDVQVTTGSGDIVIKEHNGNVGGSAGSGDITITAYSLDEATSLSTGSGDLKFSVRETKAPVSLSSAAGTIYIKVKNPEADINASTSIGDIRVKLGTDANVKFDIDSRNVNSRRRKTESDPQRPEIAVRLKARRGAVTLDDFE